MHGVPAFVFAQQADLADCACLQRVLDLDVAAGEATAMADQQHDTGAAARVEHAVGFGQRSAHRFLAQHVFASLCRRDDLFGVHELGRRHNNGIDVVPLEHDAVVRVRRGVPRVRRRAGGFDVGISRCLQLHSARSSAIAGRCAERAMFPHPIKPRREPSRATPSQGACCNGAA